MKKNAGLLISILIILSILLYLKLTPDSAYDQYRDWFDKEIASEMNSQLEGINKKITNKQIKTEDYVELAAAYEKLYKDALKRKETNAAHPHLILYLKHRTEYHKGYIEYFKTKDQLVKAQLNNVYDEGNTEYQLFLDGLEKFARAYNERFNYPPILY